MIHYIKGFVTDTLPGRIIVENNGIGYEIFVSDNSPLLFVSSDEPVTVYTHMAVREDDVSLYGFTDSESLKMFNLLTTVSGIGNKGALAILSKLTVKELREAIVFEDSAAIAKANGVGKKTAAKVVLELKDKIGDIDVSAANVTITAKLKKGSEKEEALNALIALGFTKAEALTYLSGITDDTLSASEYVRLALRARK